VPVSLDLIAKVGLSFILGEQFVALGLTAWYLRCLR
jgi:hypothetical protein